MNNHLRQSDVSRDYISIPDRVDMFAESVIVHLRMKESVLINKKRGPRKRKTVNVVKLINIDDI